MSVRVRVSRTARIPDELRIERYARVPELGPRILFFSGGSALRDLSRHLKRFTHNSIHLITPFDSGGSSAKLRDAFGMLSVGDLRNRLMALADESVRGNPEIYDLFAYRLPHDAAPEELATRLASMIAGDDDLVRAVPQPMRRIIRVHLRQLAERLPASFDLRGASVGNLVLAGGYLANDRDIESVVFLFSRLVEVRGIVRPVADVDLQLVCELADGRRLVGQHLVTGKEVDPIGSPVRDMYLVADASRTEPFRPQVHKRVAPLIAGADLICYPVGSFYSSVLANLLPAGVGRAVADADCPKVYVPNAGRDPEQLGMTLADSVETLLRFVRRDCGDEIPADRILDLVLVDGAWLEATASDQLEHVAALGVDVVAADLATATSGSSHDPERLTEALLSLT